MLQTECTEMYTESDKFILCYCICCRYWQYEKKKKTLLILEVCDGCEKTQDIKPIPNNWIIISMSEYEWHNMTRGNFKWEKKHLLVLSWGYVIIRSIRNNTSLILQVELNITLKASLAKSLHVLALTADNKLAPGNSTIGSNEEWKQMYWNSSEECDRSMAKIQNAVNGSEVDRGPSRGVSHVQLRETYTYTMLPYRCTVRNSYSKAKIHNM